MMHVPNKYRVIKGPLASTLADGNNGAFYLVEKDLTVIASDGAGWEHVSVSKKNRCPTWEEMCYVKDMFWDDEDVVVQYHPKKSEYVNRHNYTLHMWRKVGYEYPTPPRGLVG